MLFNSYPFLFVFLPITLILYFLPRNLLFAKIALFVASLAFYFYWEARYLPLLLLSICFNFLIGKQILKSEKSKGWLWLGILLNLSLLFYFKYSFFFLSLFGIKIEMIALPLGISFFTFTQIAFLIDSYNRQVDTIEPLSYGLFVTVFPHLIAGPILHHSKMRPQFEENWRYFWNANNFSKGLFLFAVGIGKKVLIGDQLSPLVAQIFDQHTGLYTACQAWAGALAYTFQLYFDFSGYSDMALGLGWMLNLELPINFNSPYKARSIIDFWRRWHISLSEFLREYLYIPLGGNRKGAKRRYINLFATMLLGGIWHGAGWPFIIWGALHGFYLSIDYLLKGLINLPFIFSWFFTFIAVMIGWIFFRADTSARALMMIQGLLDFKTTSDPLLSPMRIAWIGLAAFVAFFMPNSVSLCEKFLQQSRWGFATGALTGICVLFFDQLSEFLYFQF